LSCILYTEAIHSQIIKDTTALESVQIRALPTPLSRQNAAASIAIVSSESLTKTDGISLTTVLNKIPGVYMQQATLNTTKISIRGIGSRSQYGTQKIKAYYEGIPLTTAEGESTVEDIDLETIGRIEIIKGPNSSSFGAGLGGVLHLFARAVPTNSFQTKSATTYGSYGLVKQTFLTDYNKDGTQASLAYGELHSKGFRQNSSYDRQSLTLQAKQILTTKSSVNLLGMYTKLKGYIPSSIDEDNYNNHPEKAATSWAQSQGYESYEKVLLGVGYNQQISSKWSFKTTLFSTLKKAYEPRPFNILADQSSSFGLRTSFNYHSTLWSVPYEASVGTEMATDRYSFSLFQNLYASQPNQGSVAGEEFSAKEQKSSYQNYFLQMDFSLSSKLHLETGLAHNTTQYALTDLFEKTTAVPELRYSFGKIITPRAGLSYLISSSRTIYSSISKGFSTPSVAETLTPEGAINTQLQPEIGWNYEMGFKGNFANNKVYTELNFFSTQISNLLVARRTAEDQYIGINAGSSSHIGAELLLEYQVLKTKNYQLDSYFSAALNHFTFKDFVDNGNDYSGNRLPAVPNSQWNIGVSVTTASGLQLHTAFSTMGAMPLNDQNSKYSTRYAVLDSKVSYHFSILKQLETTLFAGVNNATNERYAASILPNAVGFGMAKPRYYYPGNPRNYYGGINLNFRIQ
jgi:iron complex outermembrane receptor protein